MTLRAKASYGASFEGQPDGVSVIELEEDADSEELNGCGETLYSFTAFVSGSEQVFIIGGRGFLA